jgi:colicin import membrane protein
MADGGDAGIPLDIDLMQTLVWAVQEHARYLSDQSRIRGPAGSPPADAAAAYEQAAAESFRAFLQRIEDVARRLGGRDRSPDAQIINVITAMLPDPWVQRPPTGLSVLSRAAARYFVKPILV